MEVYCTKGVKGGEGRIRVWVDRTSVAGSTYHPTQIINPRKNNIKDIKCFRENLL